MAPPAPPAELSTKAQLPTVAVPLSVVWMTPPYSAAVLPTNVQLEKNTPPLVEANTPPLPAVELAVNEQFKKESELPYALLTAPPPRVAELPMKRQSRTVVRYWLG